jgi:hypothetical protein
MEGFRFYDIVRWKRGPLMTMEWNGIYVPTLNTPMDLNGDGVLDVAFYKTMPSPAVPGVTYINVSATVSNIGECTAFSNDNFGELTWLNTIPRAWDDKNYYYPIPLVHITTNPKLVQNPGW